MPDKLRHTILLVAVLIAINHPALSQGEYLRKGESGLGVSSSLSTITSNNTGDNSIGFSIGCSFSSTIDVSLSYAAARPSSDEAIAPSISYYLSKQSKDVEETFALSLIAQHLSNGGQTQNNLGLGLTFAHDLFYAGSFILQPTIGVALYPIHSQQSQSVSGATIGLGVGMRFQEGHCLILSPVAAYQSGNVMVGASIGLIACFSPAPE